MAQEAEGFFWANRKPGEPGSYESLVARRKIAESLLGRRSAAPKNIGEGINALGEAFADTMMLRDLDARERAYGAYTRDLIGGLAPPGGSYAPAPIGGGSGGGGGVTPPPVGGAVAPVTAPPAPRTGGTPIPPAAIPAPAAGGDFLGLPLARVAPATPERVADVGGIPVEEFSPTAINPIDAAAVARESPRFKTERNPDVARHIGFEGAVTGIPPELQARLLAAYQAMPPELRESFVLNEGARTRAQQAEYYARGAGRRMVAPPGSSRHELGNAGAVDIQAGPARDWLLRNAGQFGLENLRGDPPHYQMTRGGRSFLPPATGREGLARILADRAEPAEAGLPTEAGLPPAPARAPASAPAPAPALARPSPAPLAPTGATPLGGSVSTVGGGGGPEGDELAALPPNPPTPAPASLAPMPPMPPMPPSAADPMGMLSPTPVAAREGMEGFEPATPALAPPAPPARPPAGAAALAGAAGVVGPADTAAARPPVLGDALPPAGGITAAPPNGIPPSMLGQGFAPFPTVPASGPTSRAPAPAAALPPPAGPTTGPALPAEGIEPAPADLSALTRPIPTGLPTIPPYEEELKRPRPRDPGPEEQRLMRIATHHGDPNIKSAAEANLRLYQEFRKAADAADLEEYTHERGQRATRMEKRREAILNMPEKDLAALRTQLQITLDRAKGPLEIAKARKDLEILDLDIERKKQELGEADTVTIDGKLYERPKRAPPGTPYKLAAGVADSEKLTADQKNTLLHFQAATLANRQLNEATNTDAVLAQLPAHYAAKAPVVGNFLIPPEYRGAKNAADDWMLTHIRNVSGAVIGRDEIPQHYHLYFPMPGDDAKEIERKRERRDAKNRALYDTLGDAKPAVTRYLRGEFNREAARPDAEPRNAGELRRLSPGRWFKAPNSERMQVPLEER